MANYPEDLQKGHYYQFNHRGFKTKAEYIGCAFETYIFSDEGTPSYLSKTEVKQVTKLNKCLKIIEEIKILLERDSH